MAYQPDPLLVALGQWSLALAVVGVFVLAAWKLVEWFEFAGYDETEEQREIDHTQFFLPEWQRLHTEKGTAPVKRRIVGGAASVGELSGMYADLEPRVNDLKERIASIDRDLETTGWAVSALHGAAQLACQAWASSLDASSARMIARACRQAQRALAMQRETNGRTLADMHSSLEQLVRDIGRPDPSPPVRGVAVRDESTTSEVPPIPGPGRTRAAIEQGLRAVEKARADYERSSQALSDLREWASAQLVPVLEEELGKPGSEASARRALDEAGIAVIEPQTGDASDGQQHEEVAEGAASPECPPGHVLRAVRRGYRWRDIVLRKAQVVVAVSASGDQTQAREVN